MKTKNILTVLLCLLAGLIVGCSTPRKLVSSTKEAAKVEEKRTEATTGEVTHFVDTTKKNGVEVTYTKVEFFPPGAKSEQAPATEPAPGAADNIDRTPKRPANTQGAIKSIESYTVKQNTEAAGVTKDEEKTQTTKAEEINTDTDKVTDVTEKPAPDPYRWRYILAILVVLVVVFLWLRKKNVFAGIAAFVRRLF